MAQEDFDFRKTCQRRHLKVKHLLNKDINQAMAEIEQIGLEAKALEEEERSLRYRVRLMRHLFTDLLNKQKIRQLQLRRQKK